jgi:hypothetical protein
VLLVARRGAALVLRLGLARRAAASAFATLPYRLRSLASIARRDELVLRWDERASAARTCRGSIGYEGRLPRSGPAPRG